MRDGSARRRRGEAPCRTDGPRASGYTSNRHCHGGVLAWPGLRAFREFRRRHPDVELLVHHLVSVHQVEASYRIDWTWGWLPLSPRGAKNWSTASSRWTGWFFAVPKGHPLTKRERLRLRDLRDLPFTWFHRWVNPAFHDQMMAACARGGLSAPRVVQEATDRDTVLGLVQCRIGIAWVTESTRWHCPKGIVLLPVVDMNVRLPFNVIWQKNNSSPVLQQFLAQVRMGNRTGPRLKSASA